MSRSETPEDRARREALETTIRGIGSALRGALPEGIGFTLLLWTEGDGGSFSYLSSGDRAGTASMLRELLDCVDLQPPHRAEAGFIADMHSAPGGGWIVLTYVDDADPHALCWVLTCKAHGSTQRTGTVRTGRLAMLAPAAWCPGCKGARS